VTKPTVLRTAKVITWDDLEKTRTEHTIKQAKKAEKEAKKAVRQAKKVTNTTVQAESTVGKRKRGRKRESAWLEVDTPEPKAKRVQRREGQAAEANQEVGMLELKAPVPGVEVPPELWRAPVAKMW